MTALDDLPSVNSVLSLDLKTASLIIAAIGVTTSLSLGYIRFMLKTGSGVVHPMAYGCSFFLPISYLLVTIWILVALYFAASVVLFFGILQDDVLLCSIWVWYTLIFVVVMLMMMILLALVFTSRKQKNRVIVAVLGMLWYIVTVYFIIVVNSHRMKLTKTTTLPQNVHLL